MSRPDWEFRVYKKETHTPRIGEDMATNSIRFLKLVTASLTTHTHRFKIKKRKETLRQHTRSIAVKWFNKNKKMRVTHLLARLLLLLVACLVPTGAEELNNTLRCSAWRFRYWFYTRVSALATWRRRIQLLLMRTTPSSALAATTALVPIII